MTNPTAVLFDLDDTLYPERSFVDGGFAAVAAFLARPLGRPAKDLAARLSSLHDIEGRGRLFDRLVEENGHGGDRDLVFASVLIYRTHLPVLEPFDGVVETLRAVRAAGMRTGLVSDGHAAIQHRKLAAMPAVAREIEVVVMTEDLGPAYVKPSSVPFRVACRILGVAPDTVVYVANDARKDFIGARASGMATIRVGGPPDEGGGTMAAIEEAADADRSVATIADALPLLFGRSRETRP